MDGGNNFWSSTTINRGSFQYIPPSGGWWKLSKQDGHPVDISHQRVDFTCLAAQVATDLVIRGGRGACKYNGRGSCGSLNTKAEGRQQYFIWTASGDAKRPVTKRVASESCDVCPTDGASFSVIFALRVHTSHIVVSLCRMRI